MEIKNIETEIYLQIKPPPTNLAEEIQLLKRKVEYLVVKKLKHEINDESVYLGCKR